MGTSEDLNKVTEVLQVLLERTKARSVTWEEVRPDRYLFSTRSSSVTLESVDSDNNLPISLNIVNAEGATVVSEQFGGRAPDSDLERRANDLILELYRTVHKDYNKVDQTLDALLSDLMDEPPF